MPTLIIIVQTTTYGQLPTHDMMSITYTKEPIYFQMTKVEVATVITVAARLF